MTKSLNTGIVTINNYNSRVPELVTLLTVAHEVGHSFGSEHDPEGTCSPGGTNGNYIMYSRATSGSDPNNQVFSSCSLQQMGSIFSFIVSNKFCFECKISEVKLRTFMFINNNNKYIIVLIGSTSRCYLWEWNH